MASPAKVDKFGRTLGQRIVMELVGLARGIVSLVGSVIKGLLSLALIAAGAFLLYSLSAWLLFNRSVRIVEWIFSR